MSISFDGHIHVPRLNISTPSLCIGQIEYKMLGKSPETERTISMDNVHCVHGNWPLPGSMYDIQCPLSPWTMSSESMSMDSVDNFYGLYDIVH